MRTSAPRAFACRSEPFTRHAHGVAEGAEDHSRAAGNLNAGIDAPHRQDAHRAAGTMNKFDVLRQQLVEPEFKMAWVWPPQTSMMRSGRAAVCGADEHAAEDGPPAASPVRGAVFIVTHYRSSPYSSARRPAPRQTYFAAPRGCRGLRLRVTLMAKPTCTSTHWPSRGWPCSSTAPTSVRSTSR